MIYNLKGIFILFVYKAGGDADYVACQRTLRVASIGAVLFPIFLLALECCCCSFIVPPGGGYVYRGPPCEFHNSAGKTKIRPAEYNYDEFRNHRRN